MERPDWQKKSLDYKNETFPERNENLCLDLKGLTAFQAKSEICS